MEASSIQNIWLTDLLAIIGVKYVFQIPRNLAIHKEKYLTFQFNDTINNI